MFHVDRTAVEVVNEGDLLATEHLAPNAVTADYRRVRVVKILEGKPRKAVLQCVDSGEEITKAVS